MKQLRVHPTVIVNFRVEYIRKSSSTGVRYLGWKELMDGIRVSQQHRVLVVIFRVTTTSTTVLSGLLRIT